MNNRLYISMYHYTRDLKHSRYPGIKGLDVSLFKKQLDFFRHNFSVVRMEDVIAAVCGANDLPENPLLLTFDDGYIDNYTYALPLLEEYGFQGSFFIPGKTFTSHRLLDVNKIHYILASAPDICSLVNDLKRRIDYYRDNEWSIAGNEYLWEKYAVANRFDNEGVVFVKRILQTVLPEKLRNIISSELFKKYVGITEEHLAYELYMTEDQIRTMKRHGMYIGIHGYDHYWLGQLSENEMKNDIDKALETLDEFIDHDLWVMNYPYGSYDDKVIDYVKKRGAIIGLATEVRIAELGKDCQYSLPRFDCNDFPPKSCNYKN